MSRRLNIVIAGAAGRMGQALARCIARTPGIALVGAVEARGHAAIGADAGTLAGIAPCGVKVTTDVRAALAKADVLVDFSFHGSAPANAAAAVAARVPLVLGTTGLSAAETKAVRAAARKVPVVWAPNMSLGVNLLFALTRQAAQTLGLDYDAEIVEVHHRHKKDAPSGTALRLGEKVAAGRGQDSAKVTVHGRSGITGERPRGQIGIHAVRAGDAIGDHTVMFSTEGERVELVHHASSRDAFAMGALTAARWALRRKPGLYDMQDVLGL